MPGYDGVVKTGLRGDIREAGVKRKSGRLAARGSLDAPRSHALAGLTRLISKQLRRGKSKQRQGAATRQNCIYLKLM